jgi:hypothetical protein
MPLVSRRAPDYSGNSILKSSPIMSLRGSRGRAGGAFDREMHRNFGGNRRDVERAQRRAALLRQARYPAVAVAGGTEATAGARQAASETAVALLLDGRIDGWQEAVDHMLAEGEAGSP